MNFYDDNFGWYELGPGDDPEETGEFYRRTQAESVWKKCSGCNRRVKIKRDYAYCNACADKREHGFDI